ncbi:uncharacterized protein [Nicotiana sylvestris]|uniref:uncharacterized protein n=1 Tax=Nicotiana sylvestris TaxID=4096 RepID=UPI00388CB736
MKKFEETGPMVPKDRKEYSDIDRKAVEKNYRAKKILVCGIGTDEYNRVSVCDAAKEIWEALQTTHEGTTQVKQSKIDMLTIENKLVRKILSVLLGSWERKVNTIIEAKDLQTLTIEELIGNLKTYEMKRKKDSERREPKKEKNMVLKAKSSDSSDEDSDMAYLTKRFQKMVRRNGGIPKRGSSTDNIVKQALAAWGDSPVNQKGNQIQKIMMAVETEATKYDSLFALMAQCDEDEDDEVNFRDVLRNLKSYSSKKLRDDLVVCVVDLNETIINLEKEKEALNEKITSVENERDDLMVVVVDLKEIVEEETIKGLNREHRTVSLGKGKEVASETHIKLEHELNDVKTSLCGELEKNRQLQAELEKVKSDLEKSLKWTWSSDAVTTMYLNNNGNRQGIGF